MSVLLSYLHEGQEDRLIHLLHINRWDHQGSTDASVYFDSPLFPGIK